MKLFLYSYTRNFNVKVSACGGKAVIGTEERNVENWISSRPWVYLSTSVMVCPIYVKPTDPVCCH